MAKRWIVLLLAVALGLAVVPLAAAGNGAGGDTGKGKLKFELVGTVGAAVATGETTLTVKVKAGNKPVKKFRGGVLDLDASNARVRIVTAEGCKTATLDEVLGLAGAKVKVRGRVDDSIPGSPVYVALDIKPRASAEPALLPGK